MIISVRTLVNTTLFRAFLLCAFWAYTRWIDDTPAKKLLYSIGWTQLWELTIINTENISLSGDVFNQRLDKIETLIQATNMNCSLSLLEAGKQNTVENSTNIVLPSLSTMNTLEIPVFDLISDNKLPIEQRANIKSFTTIKRPITSNKLQTPSDIINFLKNITLTTEEQKKWYINLFDWQKFTIGIQTLKENILTLSFTGIESLSSTQQILITEAIKKVFSQFPEIQTVIIL